MGKKMTFHIFSFQKSVRFVIVSTRPRHYFWLSIYVEPDFRNKIICQEICIYILNTLPGEHEIHWSKNLSTLNELAKKYCWSIKKPSKIFEGCQFACIKGFTYNSFFAPIFKKILKHNVTTKRPKLDNYFSVNDEIQVIANIYEQTIKCTS